MLLFFGISANKHMTNCVFGWTEAWDLNLSGLKFRYCNILWLFYCCFIFLRCGEFWIPTLWIMLAWFFYGIWTCFKDRHTIFDCTNDCCSLCLYHPWHSSCCICCLVIFTCTVLHGYIIIWQFYWFGHHGFPTWGCWNCFYGIIGTGMLWYCYR